MYRCAHHLFQIIIVVVRVFRQKARWHHQILHLEWRASWEFLGGNDPVPGGNQRAGGAIRSRACERCSPTSCTGISSARSSSCGTPCGQARSSQPVEMKPTRPESQTTASGLQPCAPAPTVQLPILARVQPALHFAHGTVRCVATRTWDRCLQLPQLAMCVRVVTMPFLFRAQVCRVRSKFEFRRGTQPGIRRLDGCG